MGSEQRRGIRLVMRIGIVGLGLMGGSLGLDLRALDHEVWGVSRQGTTCDRAVARGAVDRAGTDLTLLRGCDLIFVCTPIALVVPMVSQLRETLGGDPVITDVASVKGSIVGAIADRRFVGGHPMAGTADQGIEAALTGLFRGAAYVVTPTPTTDPAAVLLVEDLARALGSRCYRCDPVEHDQAVALISHGPVWVSAALVMTAAAGDPAGVSLAKNLASTGFASTSRIGGGNPELGLMMAQHNRGAILGMLQRYRQELDHLIADLKGEHWDRLEAYLQQTQEIRPQFVRSLSESI